MDQSKVAEREITGGIEKPSSQTGTHYTLLDSSVSKMACVNLSSSTWVYLIGVYINDILFGIDLCLLLIKKIKIEYRDEESSDEVNQIDAGRRNLDTEHDILPSLLCLLSCFLDSLEKNDLYKRRLEWAQCSRGIGLYYRCSVLVGEG